MTRVGKEQPRAPETDGPSADRTRGDKTALELREDADNRDLFQPETRYKPEHLRVQFWECIYVMALLLVSLTVLALAGLGVLNNFLIANDIAETTVRSAHKYQLFFAGGLLGGTVYGAKWLYHAIAKGLWNIDRRPWRFMSPWIAVGTTIGICLLVDAGFLKSATAPIAPTTAAGFAGLGFLVGYLADSFLAKMKEVTRVVFGESETHPNRPKEPWQEDR